MRPFCFLLLVLAPLLTQAQVGIGTTVPLARLHVEGGDALFSAAGDVPGTAAALGVSGAGRRQLWYADKAAFRAGYVNGTQWDAGNIGNYSFAAGYNTRASGAYAVALGNTAVASGEQSLSFNGTASAAGGIALGSGSQAIGDDALALGPSSIAGGLASITLGPSTAYGNFAVAIGLQNSAGGQFSMALGKNARSPNQGSVTISDASATFSNDYITSTANNQLNMRFAGGYYLYSTANANAPSPTNNGAVAGVQLAAGAGSWTTLSDRRRKENFRPLDAEQVLRKVAALPITEWNYKSQPASQRHVGPMAQDFCTAFRLDGIGRDTTINTGDIDGINMLAIQALYRQVQELQAENARLRQHCTQQAATASAAFEERLRRLEAQLSTQARH